MFVCLFTASANAIEIVSDSVESGEWGLIQFDWAGGLIEINGFGDGYTTGETGIGVSDMYFSLLEDDGSSFNSFTGNLIAFNDDSRSSGWDADGSFSVVDSFIDNLNLASGSFLLTISSCCENFDDFRDISLNSGFTRATSDYQVTFSDGAIITALNGEAINNVPEPSGFALIVLGA